MNMDAVMVAVGAVVLFVNITTMLLTFPTKRGLPFTIGALALYTAVFYLFLNWAEIIIPGKGGLPGLAYLPLMLLLFEGKFFQKIFAFFLQFLLTSLQLFFAQTISLIFLPYGTILAFSVFLGLLLSMLTVYLFVVFRFGRRFFQKLFEDGKSTEWALYAFGAVFSFAVQSVSQLAPGGTLHIILLLFFILWSFAVLCYAIISTHEKSRQQYEAEFARSVVSAGSDHYQKMNEMHDTLRMMRHDYKYHLDTISELLNADKQNEIEKYLSDIQKHFIEKELPAFCQNSVINALLASYAERCAKLDIKYEVEISIPETMSVPNYEMCIILGNLLENAVSACSEQKYERRIKLVIHTQGAHLVIMVQNGFSGNLVQAGDLPASTKKGGGLGLKSIQAVARRYCGELLTEWNGNIFTAYVLIKV